jgi:hypothetical protein
MRIAVGLALVFVPSSAAVLIAFAIWAHGMFTVRISAVGLVELSMIGAVGALSIMCGAWLLTRHVRDRG